MDLTDFQVLDDNIFAYLIAIERQNKIVPDCCEALVTKFTCGHTTVALQKCFGQTAIQSNGHKVTAQKTTRLNCLCIHCSRADQQITKPIETIYRGVPDERVTAFQLQIDSPLELQPDNGPRTELRERRGKSTPRHSEFERSQAVQSARLGRGDGPNGFRNHATRRVDVLRREHDIQAKREAEMRARVKKPELWGGLGNVTRPPLASEVRKQQQKANRAQAQENASSRRKVRSGKGTMKPAKHAKESHMSSIAGQSSEPDATVHGQSRLGGRHHGSRTATAVNQSVEARLETISYPGEYVGQVSTRFLELVDTGNPEEPLLGAHPANMLANDTTIKGPPQPSSLNMYSNRPRIVHNGNVHNRFVVNNYHPAADMPVLPKIELSADLSQLGLMHAPLRYEEALLPQQSIRGCQQAQMGADENTYGPISQDTMTSFQPYELAICPAEVQRTLPLRNLGYEPAGENNYTENLSLPDNGTMADATLDSGFVNKNQEFDFGGFSPVVPQQTQAGGLPYKDAHDFALPGLDENQRDAFTGNAGMILADSQDSAPDRLLPINPQYHVDSAQQAEKNAGPGTFEARNELGEFADIEFDFGDWIADYDSKL